MNSITRARHKIIDDVHSIRNPLGNGPKDLEIFVNTLLKTRIPTLFKTVAGFPGHAEQIQMQINRLERTKGLSDEKNAQLTCAAKTIKHALQSSIKAAQANGFPFDSIWRISI